MKDSARHVILGSQQFRPVDFARQMNLNIDNGWGILRCIIDVCMKLDNGKYLIMKDANRVSRNAIINVGGGGCSQNFKIPVWGVLNLFIFFLTGSLFLALLFQQKNSDLDK